MPTANANYISIFVTTECNLECAYCYAFPNVHKKIVDSNFAKKGIDDFFEKTGNRGLRFQGGGEPTLEMDLIKDITHYTEKKYGEIKVELQTNGYFDDEAAEWIAKHVDIVWISLDGPAEINRVHRPKIGGKDITGVVEKNIKYLTASSKTTVGIRSCITSLNVDKQKELVDYCMSLGVKTVYADNVFDVGNNSEYMKSKGYGTPNMSLYIENFIEAYRYAQKAGSFYGNWMIVNFSKECNKNCSSCVPYPRLTSDGFVSSCDVCSLGEQGPKVFIYGKWCSDTQNIEYDCSAQLNLSNRRLPYLEMCGMCDVSMFCAGGCMGKAYLRTGDIMKPDKKMCGFIKLLAKELGVGEGKKSYELEHP